MVLITPILLAKFFVWICWGSLSTMLFCASLPVTWHLPVLVQTRMHNLVLDLDDRDVKNQFCLMESLLSLCLMLLNFWLDMMPITFLSFNTASVLKINLVRWKYFLLCKNDFFSQNIQKMASISSDILSTCYVWKYCSLCFLRSEKIWQMLYLQI